MAYSQADKNLVMQIYKRDRHKSIVEIAESLELRASTIAYFCKCAKVKMRNGDYMESRLDQERRSKRGKQLAMKCKNSDKNMSEIARMFGVSRQRIEFACRAYGIKKHMVHTEV